jgi:hypothetical protein
MPSPVPSIQNPKQEVCRSIFTAGLAEKTTPFFEIETPFWPDTKKGQALQLDLLYILPDPEQDLPWTYT